VIVIVIVIVIAQFVIVIVIVMVLAQGGAILRSVHFQPRYFRRPPGTRFKHKARIVMVYRSFPLLGLCSPYVPGCFPFAWRVCQGFPTTARYAFQTQGENPNGLPFVPFTWPVLPVRSRMFSLCLAGVPGFSDHRQVRVSNTRRES
jgi:hypothetical protein